PQLRLVVCSSRTSSRHHFCRKRQEKNVKERRKTNPNPKVHKQMTEEEMMDLALRLSEQEASVTALRVQQEEEAMMKAIQESVSTSLHEAQTQLQINDNVCTCLLSTTNQSSDSTQIDDCQLGKSPVFPSTDCKAKVHVPRLCQDLLEACRTSGFVFCSQDSVTSTRKSQTTQAKSPIFPKSPKRSNNLPLSKSLVFLETDQEDDGETDQSPEYLKSPVFGRNAQHETTPSLPSAAERGPRPISSQGSVSRASAPPREPAGGPTVHYYWGVPFCPRGVDPDEYTQVILGHMEVYEKSLKQAQRGLLRKAEWGEAVLPQSLILMHQCLVNTHKGRVTS
uniref:RAP80 N-terminal domain-containing protein n=1 Tax=Cyclopterus lumpus TaxID=8103 RepID=A0A8C2Z1C4_CYCLU